MKKPLLALLSLASLAAVASAQAPAAASSPAQGSRSDAIMLNIKKLDVLIQVVPLALTKDQVSALLLSIEKVRQQEKQLRAQEDKDLIQIDAKTAKLVDDGVQKGSYPAREAQVEIAKFMGVMGIRRSMAAIDYINIVYDTCTKTLNAGQLKVMEKSLKPELLDPSLKVDQMDSAAKVKFFIRKVLLDPVAYDVLIDMAKKKE